jgi:hypothetical protein
MWFLLGRFFLQIFSYHSRFLEVMVPVISSKRRRIIVAAKRVSSKSASGSLSAGMRTFRHSSWYLSGVRRSTSRVRLRCFEDTAKMAKCKAGDVAAAWTTTVEKCLCLSRKSNWRRISYWYTLKEFCEHTHRDNSVEK